MVISYSFQTSKSYLKAGYFSFCCAWKVKLQRYSHWLLCILFIRITFLFMLQTESGRFILQKCLKVSTFFIYDYMNMSNIFSFYFPQLDVVTHTLWLFFSFLKQLFLKRLIYPGCQPIISYMPEKASHLCRNVSFDDLLESMVVLDFFEYFSLDFNCFCS